MKMKKKIIPIIISAIIFLVGCITAIIGARTANIAFVYDGLKDAIRLNPALAQKAANDLEFRKYAQDQTFQSIIK